MRCPSCSHQESKVVDSRSNDESTSIRRRRECLKCGTRFTTYERLGENPMIVIKSDGSSEAYNRKKLFHGILVACAKRPVSADAISSIIDDIEIEIRKHPKCEIGSKELGDMVVERLSELDVVAYVRFASVYKDYQDVDEFLGALHALQSKKKD